MIVAEKLYQDYPHLSEGEMTKLRAAMVRRETLARIARNIGLGNHLYLGKGEEASGGRNKSANLAAVLEAVIAAIFLDQGLSVTRDFIMGLTGAELEKVVNRGVTIDYKSELQELIQAREQHPPTYHVIEATGPDHARTFNVEVRVGPNVLGRGSGKSKKEAETEAARSALEKLTTNFTR
jgi:ribonuclease-3